MCRGDGRLGSSIEDGSATLTPLLSFFFLFFAPLELSTAISAIIPMKHGIPIASPRTAISGENLVLLSDDGSDEENNVRLYVSVCCGTAPHFYTIYVTFRRRKHITAKHG